MTREITRELLWALADRCAFPAVQIGKTTLTDDGAWRWGLKQSTPAERITLLLALHGELLRLSAGGRAWLAEPPMRDFYNTDAEPFFVGDRSLLEHVRAAIALLPDVVKWVVLRHVAFVGVGVESTAWASSADFIDPSGFRKRRLIALGPSADPETVLHECAHQWNYGPPREQSHAITAQGEEGFLAHMVEVGWSERAAKWERAEERLATGLALCWLYSKPEGRAA